MGRKAGKSDFETLGIIVSELIDVRSHTIPGKREFIDVIIKRAGIKRRAVYKALETLKQSGILVEKDTVYTPKKVMFAPISEVGPGKGYLNRVKALEIDLVQVWKRIMGLEIKVFEKRKDVSELPDDIRSIVIRHKTISLIQWYVRETILESDTILKYIDRIYSEGRTPSDSLYNYVFNNDKDAVMTYLKMWKEQ